MTEEAELMAINVERLSTCDPVLCCHYLAREWRRVAVEPTRDAENSQLIDFKQLH